MGETITSIKGDQVYGSYGHCESDMSQFSYKF